MVVVVVQELVQKHFLLEARQKRLLAELQLVYPIKAQAHTPHPIDGSRPTTTD